MFNCSFYSVGEVIVVDSTRLRSKSFSGPERSLKKILLAKQCRSVVCVGLKTFCEPNR